MELLSNFEPDVIAFPEYYFVDTRFQGIAESFAIKSEIIGRLRNWSVRFNCAIIGGSLVEEVAGTKYNRCYVVNRGEIIGFYDKIHLFRDEGQGLIRPGFEYRVFNTGDLRIGILICADVLYPDSFRNIRGLGPEIIFAPTTSQHKPEETTAGKYKRDSEIFAKGSIAANAIVVKVSASGILTGRRLQGRSLIAGHDKILWRIEPQDEDKSALALAILKFERGEPLLDISVHRP